MSGQPAISCVMAAFNAERYLADAVESILAQSFADFEFLVIDDGSTDQTTARLEEYAGRDPRMQLFRQSNQGLTRSLNFGASRARGAYLARMDADDIAEPNRFADQIAFMEQHAACVALGSSLTLIDPEGEPLAMQPSPEAHESIVEQLLNGHGALPHPTAMIRMTAFRHVEGYRERFRYAQDLDLWLRLMECGWLANLPQPLLRYRMHAQAITAKRREEQLACAREAVLEARRRLGLSTQDELLAADSHSTSPARAFRSWSRMAMRSGNLRVARKHAWSAVKTEPWSPSNLGLVAKLALSRVINAVTF